MDHGFGIIGTGDIAAVHARAIGTIANAHLAGVTDIVRDKAHAFGEQFNCNVFDSASALINSPEIEIVCICTPSGTHLEPALLAIDAGRHCIIEKPLEVTVSRCRTIIDAAKKKNVLVAGIFPMRFLDINMEVRKAVESGRFGKMIMGDVYVKWFRSQTYYDQVKWRGDPEISGGGAVMNQAIHSVDLLRWMMGEVKEVSAFSAMLGHHDLDVEDTAVATLRFENGALGVIEASTAVFPGSYKRMEILGTGGSVITEEETIVKWEFSEESDLDNEIRLRFSGEETVGGGVTDPKAIKDTGHIRQISDMVEALETGRPPVIDAEEAAKAVEIIEAIYKSARTGMTVSL